MRRVLRVIISLIGIGIGIGLVALVLYNVKYPGYEYVLRYTTVNSAIIGMYTAAGVVFGILAYYFAPRIIDRIANLFKGISNWYHRTPALDVLSGTLGLILGLLLAFLISLAFRNISIPGVSTAINVLLYAVLGFCGFRFGVRKRAEIIGGVKKEDGIVAKPKVLDTSVIIDGRIYDISKTGMLEGELIVPTFVLKELRHIADSSDAIKRGRGRRGLDTIKALQEMKENKITVDERDFDDVDEVDAKLIRLASEVGGILVTNDYNLNKVATVQKVPVWNVNDLANALKPVLLPGETFELSIVKEGKENGQGIGYLSDGTIVVVDGGKQAIGEAKEVEVTSTLQTSAGRMVFAKINTK